MIVHYSEWVKKHSLLHFRFRSHGTVFVACCSQQSDSNHCDVPMVFFTIGLKIGCRNTGLVMSELFHSCIKQKAFGGMFLHENANSTSAHSSHTWINLTNLKLNLEVTWMEGFSQRVKRLLPSVHKSHHYLSRKSRHQTENAEPGLSWG